MERLIIKNTTIVTVIDWYFTVNDMIFCHGFLLVINCYYRELMLTIAKNAKNGPGAFEKNNIEEIQFLLLKRFPKILPMSKASIVAIKALVEH